MFALLADQEARAMITLAQYAGKWLGCDDWTPERAANAGRLLAACALLEAKMLADGVAFPINPATSSGVSGKHYGGFRPQAATVGAKNSNHKEGLAVDRFDPVGKIDAWCMAHLDILDEYEIWIEHPEKTEGWSHWQGLPPKSGRRVFYP